MKLQPEKQETIEAAADLIAGHTSVMARNMMLELFVELAENYPQAGKGSQEAWLAALRGLGETCITLHKMLARPK